MYDLESEVIFALSVEEFHHGSIAGAPDLALIHFHQALRAEIGAHNLAVSIDI